MRVVREPVAEPGLENMQSRYSLAFFLPFLVSRKG